MHVEPAQLCLVNLSVPGLSSQSETDRHQLHNMAAAGMPVAKFSNLFGQADLWDSPDVAMNHVHAIFGAASTANQNEARTVVSDGTSKVANSPACPLLCAYSKLEATE